VNKDFFKLISKLFAKKKETPDVGEKFMFSPTSGVSWSNSEMTGMPF